MVNQSAVRAALHVPTNSLFFSGDNGAGMTYVPTEKNLMPFYQHVAKNTSLRVLVYNGDTDPGLNSQRAENWTAASASRRRRAGGRGRWTTACASAVM